MKRLFILLVFLPHMIFAYSSVEDGIQSFFDGDYRKAFKTLNLPKNRNNAEAQYFIGEMYYQGQGTLKNTNKAIEWYKKAAAQGEISSMVNLGVAYQLGDGVLSDPDKAFYYFKKAADAGSPSGMANLGEMYIDGIGTSRSLYKAKKVLQKAYEHPEITERKREYIKMMWDRNELWKY